jgi:glutathione S-transferase
MALAEKGVTIPIQTVDLRGGENRREPYLTQINPVGQLPTLELDDGTMLTEITAICEYIEELHPAPALIGTTPAERAETRMWVRRLDLNIVEPMTSGYRYSEGLKFFQRRMRCIPQAADDLKAIAQHWLAWLDGRLTGPYICGDRFTLADIHLFAFLDFGAKVGQPLDPAKLAIAGWYDRVKARPSAAA